MFNPSSEFIARRLCTQTEGTFGVSSHSAEPKRGAFTGLALFWNFDLIVTEQVLEWKCLDHFRRRWTLKLSQSRSAERRGTQSDVHVAFADRYSAVL